MELSAVSSRVNFPFFNLLSDFRPSSNKKSVIITVILLFAFEALSNAGFNFEKLLL